MGKKTIVFDFDGVIHKYSKGWQDGTIYDEPVEGIREVISQLRNKYKVVIVSTRCTTNGGRIAINDWLIKNNIEVDELCMEKPPALVYVDDRAITFDPANINHLVDDIDNFKTWQQKQNNPNQTNLF